MKNFICGKKQRVDNRCVSRLFTIGQSGGNDGLLLSFNPVRHVYFIPRSAYIFGVPSEADLRSHAFGAKAFT